jgi:hypothetical protein
MSPTPETARVLLPRLQRRAARKDPWALPDVSHLVVARPNRVR